jgi:hypothetical protein
MAMAGSLGLDAFPRWGTRTEARILLAAVLFPAASVCLHDLDGLDGVKSDWMVFMAAGLGGGGWWGLFRRSARCAASAAVAGEDEADMPASCAWLRREGHAPTPMAVCGRD